MHKRHPAIHPIPLPPSPQGCCASSDMWCRESEKVIHGMPFARKLVDDILVWADTVEKLQGNIISILSACEAMNLTISRKKLCMGSSAKFAGHIVSASGIKPDPDLLAAIKDFPVPKDRKHVISFLGLAVQLGNFLPDLAHNTMLLRKLTSDKNTFLWLYSPQSAVSLLEKDPHIGHVGQTFRPRSPNLLGHRHLMSLQPGICPPPA